MRPLLRLFAIGCVFLFTTIAWTRLGDLMSRRSGVQMYDMRERVEGLWGQPQTQTAPKMTFEWHPTREVTRTEMVKGERKTITEKVVQTELATEDVGIAATHVDVGLNLDQRLKGLVWYALYDVSFRGAWTYVHASKEAGHLRFRFTFPDRSGMYDAYRFVVDGAPRDIEPKDGVAEVVLPVVPGQKIEISVGYKSRGLDEWRYTPNTGVGSLKDFSLGMTTDFADIDFPASAMSPSDRTRSSSGWILGWRFDQIVTAHDIGMRMPTRVQPGALAASLAFSAPISLGFFFLLLLVLGRLRGLDLHPVNFVFIAAGFFAFHLLFAYSVDHIHLAAAFALSSATSVLLVVSYLRLVVSPRFAFVEAAGAQLIYLVGFSLAHFWEGFTGLAVTVLSIVTLFVLMQLTGRVRWDDPAPVLDRAPR